MKPLAIENMEVRDEAIANCRKDPKKYGSPVMFDFVLGTGIKLFRSMHETMRVGVRVFGRNKYSNYEDIGCVCMDRCRFYIVNNRIDSRSPSYTYIKDVIIPKLHKSDKTSSKCFVMPLWDDQFSSKNNEVQEWMVTRIREQYLGYKLELAGRNKRVN